MNYYPFHIGDYSSHTKHLTLMGDLAYRRLLDMYYMTERPLPLDPAECARLIGMRDHICDVSEVLSDFFLKSDAGWVNHRADSEISTYRQKADRARAANTKRWNAGKNLKSDAKSDAFLIPTNNQEPITNSRERAKRGTRLASDWQPSEEQIAFCRAERPDLNPKSTADRFRDYWVAQPGQKGVKLDWDATWRNWVRNETAAKGKPAAEPMRRVL